MNWTGFNISEYVKVRLTEIGYQRLADLWNICLLENPHIAATMGGMRSAEYYKYKADADGYTRFQMWDFIQKFGEVISVSAPMYFETNILIGLHD